MEYVKNNSQTVRKEIPLPTHLICWGIPILVTFLILTTNTFGCANDDDSTECWCWISDRSNSPRWTNQFWVFFSFYLWVWFSLLVYVAIFIFVLFNLQRMTGTVEKSIVGVRSILIRTLIGYPVIIIICWAMSSFYDIYITINPESPLLSDPILLIVYTCLPALQGTLTAGLFIFSHYSSMKKQALREWLREHAIDLGEGGWKKFGIRPHFKIHAEFEKVEEESRGGFFSRMSSMTGLTGKWLRGGDEAEEKESGKSTKPHKSGDPVMGFSEIEKEDAGCC
jgi:hypothetical protein